ncbi:MAG: LPP20 family lipoprotein [Treponema sp.]|nr:LPP20 family lipoprotein [Treponema sp.]
MRKQRKCFVIPASLLLSAVLFSTCASTPSSGGSQARQRQPEWINTPYVMYDEHQYIVRTGSGKSQVEAEKSALANLVGYFGLSISDDLRISTAYFEAVKNGVTDAWSDTTNIDRTIVTSASLDSLVGAEIRENWFDGRDTHHAAAVMEKAKTAQIYYSLTEANLEMIKNLTNMNPAQKNTIEGFARYQFAAIVADINLSYGNVLRVIGVAPPGELKRGDEYRLEAMEITRLIPVGITVRNDRSGRIQGAFSKALSELGFSSGGVNSRYVLAVDITSTPVTIQNNANNFTRIEVTANFTDTSTRAVLVPYTFNRREGHTSQAEADNRAYSAAERIINEEYRDILSDYLSQLLPRR